MLENMNNKRIMNWKDVFFASPGPKTAKETIILIIKGLCMGTADVIPGVSGGTIALIMGIYEDLLLAINSINISMVKKLLRGNIKDALSKVHLRFLFFLLMGIGIAILSLFFLLMGIGIAILSLARIMNYLIHNQAVLTWSLFFGLIAASIFVVGKKVKNWAGSPAISFLAGGTAAWFIVGLIPVSTPEEFWFIFLSGFIAICAMILPGLSGAFLLLILGKYEFITGALKNPFIFNNLAIIIVFCSGCVVGLLGFSRILNYLFKKWHTLTLAFLTGLMAGSMRKIWPWKKSLEGVMIRGKYYVLREQNILPKEFNAKLLLAIGLIIIGFVVVVVLEQLSGNK